MHAAIIPVTFNDRSAAEGKLEGLVAEVSGTPGFVAGYWLALSPDTGMAVVVFETAESAQEQADLARSAPVGAVTVGNVEVGEVMANA